MLFYGPVRGTTSTRTQLMFDERLPLPTRSTLTVVGLVQPDETVLLPVSPGAVTTMVAAGADPVPP